MDKQPAKTAPVVRPPVTNLKMRPVPASERHKYKTMAQLERAAARRKWFLISSAVATALIVGILIGRFLLP